MRHVWLGRTGLRVSWLCLGTMTSSLLCDEPTSRAIFDRTAAEGIRFLDTSDVYPLGGSVETVGRTEEIPGPATCHAGRLELPTVSAAMTSSSRSGRAGGGAGKVPGRAGRGRARVLGNREGP